MIEAEVEYADMPERTFEPCYTSMPTQVKLHTHQSGEELFLHGQEKPVNSLLLSSTHGNESMLSLACKFYITYCISTCFFLWEKRNESNQRKASKQQEKKQ